MSIFFSSVYDHLCVCVCMHVFLFILVFLLSIDRLNAHIAQIGAHSTFHRWSMGRGKNFLRFYLNWYRCVARFTQQTHSQSSNRSTVQNQLICTRKAKNNLLLCRNKFIFHCKTMLHLLFYCYEKINKSINNKNRCVYRFL